MATASRATRNQKGSTIAIKSGQPAIEGIPDNPKLTSENSIHAEPPIPVTARPPRNRFSRLRTTRLPGARHHAAPMPPPNDTIPARPRYPANHSAISIVLRVRPIAALYRRRSTRDQMWGHDTALLLARIHYVKIGDRRQNRFESVDQAHDLVDT